MRYRVWIALLSFWCWLWTSRHERGVAYQRDLLVELLLSLLHTALLTSHTIPPFFPNALDAWTL